VSWLSNAVPIPSALTLPMHSIVTAFVFATPVLNGLRVQPAFEHLYEIPRTERKNVGEASQQVRVSNALEAFASFLVGVDRAAAAWTGAGHCVPFRSKHAQLRCQLHPRMRMGHHGDHESLDDQGHRHHLGTDRRNFAATAAIAASMLFAPRAGRAENFGNFKLDLEVPMTDDQREQMYSQSCMEADQVDIFPFGDEAAINQCLLLPQRAITVRGKNFLITQGNMLEKELPPEMKDPKTRKPGYNGPDGTGSAVWSGAIALSRYMDKLGPEYFQGKTVVELGCGAGLASIVAVKLGAKQVFATDDDVDVLKFADKNAKANLNDEELKRFKTQRFRWGTALPTKLKDTDLIIASDVMYQQSVRPLLADAVRTINKPMILSVTGRRVGEISEVQKFLEDEEFKVRMIRSPMKKGFSAESVQFAIIGDEPSLKEFSAA